MKQNKTIFVILNISEGRRPYRCFNCILNKYHLRCDTNIGLGRCDIRIILCDCTYFRNKMNLP